MVRERGGRRTPVEDKGAIHKYLTQMIPITQKVFFLDFYCLILKEKIKTNVIEKKNVQRQI